MPDGEMKSSELLSAGRGPAEIGAGGLPFLGSGPAAGAAAMGRLKAEGVEFVESETGMGGGGEVDPVEKYFAGNLAVLGKMGEYIEAQRKAGKRDDEQVNLGGQPLCTLGEYQKVYKAIEVAQAKGDNRPIEEIIREARRPAAAVSPPSLEPQPTPRPGDWRDSLPAEQRQRLREKEQRWGQLQPAQLVAMQEKIATALSNWGLGIDWPDELKKANLLADDGEVVLKALVEAVEGRKVAILKRRIEEALVLAPEVSVHIQKLQRELGLSSREAVIATLAADLQAAVSIGRNTDVKLFPPRVKHILIQFIKSGNGTAN